MANVRLHAVVKGRVQGVGFRQFVRISASSDVIGWVRNLSNGNVEVLAEAERVELYALVNALRTGPLGSNVTDVEIVWGEATGEFTGFEIRPTV